MDEHTYTVITFSPVQDFIVKSRKLRDLYGSSYILSLLSWVICQAAKKQNIWVVSPALINLTQGMPNQIILKGKISEDEHEIEEIESSFHQVWNILTNTCREWIEKNLNQWQYTWERDWNLWSNHAWEFFAASGKPGNNISGAREKINQVKHKRDWTGINWQGESSTLSGADAIAYPGLGRIADPRKYNYQQEQQDITKFYQELSFKLGEALIQENLQLLIDNLELEELEKLEEVEELEELEELEVENISKLSEQEKLELVEKGIYDFKYYWYLLSITKLLSDKYLRLLSFYFHTLIQQRLESIKKYGYSFINPREQLSIPELIKRLITHSIIIDKFAEQFKKSKICQGDWQINKIVRDLKLRTFRDLNRHKDDKEEKKYWTGWFQGDGDGAGKYFKSLPRKDEETGTTKFSQEMRDWGKKLMEQQRTKLGGRGRMIYAGGDDFLGVLYEENKQIQPLECLQWFYTFKSSIWHWPEEKKITPSVGFVWAGSQVPQRDVLQHCHEAEQSAKKKGRDRIAFRILFNSGNYLEWVCPWWVLDMEDLGKVSHNFPHIKVPIEQKKEVANNLIESYQDRENGNNWTHFYRDVALLESRHAFDGERTIVDEKPVNNPQIDIALRLIEIYLGEEWYNIIANPQNWFNRYNEKEIQIFTGIFGDPKSFDQSYNDNLLNKLIVSGNSLQVVVDFTIFLLIILIQSKSYKFASLHLQNYLKCFICHYKVRETFNNWVINLTKVVFHLMQDKK
ncbi:type III-B CRISPR-associated protein Cas10/Cmr2 [Okeania sp. SIO3B5]|uniref:Cas10/Cmr2 second palm domain-containing protein n=1 Tax=Okeania sp. SIO3B5 TaxID=2607811 RepID=UPI0025D2ADEA|nr:type III-B CRISPR-associated protein Cas10/Cmr2 [Okeania sp. SIO3B5]